jgi:hypothetical protein
MHHCDNLRPHDSPNIVTEVKSSELGWTGHVDRLWRHRHALEGNDLEIRKLDLKILFVHLISI